MAYTINNTAGATLVTLADGTIDIATTDIALFGKGYAGFGERLNENLVKMLENFANTSAPTNKIKGQLWYDTLNNQIKVWNGSKFKPVGSSTNSATSPTNSNTGDFWFDTNNSQFYVYNGTSWTLIGPTTVSGSGVTQVSSEIVADNVGVNKSVLKLITNDTIVGIVSAEEFTPGTAISGFATIYKGITLSTAVASNKFTGTATDADKLGGIAASNYLRSDTFDTMNDRLTISSDDGLVIGAGSDLTITVGGVSGTDVTFANTSSNGDIIFTVNDGGVTKEVLRMDGSAGRIDHLRVGDLTVDGTQTIINTTTLSVEDNIIELNRNVSSNAGMPSYTGLKVNRGSISSATEQALYWVWDETFSDAGYGDAGGAWTAFKAAEGDTELEAPTLVDIRANIVHATSTSAQYADLAEMYVTKGMVDGNPYPVGTVMYVPEDIQRQAMPGCMPLEPAAAGKIPVGTISENPAFLMNNELENGQPVALKGRVPVRVIGPCMAGEPVYVADGGVASINAVGQSSIHIVGIALVSKDTEEEELVECILKV